MDVQPRQTRTPLADLFEAEPPVDPPLRAVPPASADSPGTSRGRPQRGGRALLVGVLFVAALLVGLASWSTASRSDSATPHVVSGPRPTFARHRVAKSRQPARTTRPTRVTHKRATGVGQPQRSGRLPANGRRSRAVVPTVRAVERRHQQLPTHRPPTSRQEWLGVRRPVPPNEFF